MTTDAMTRPDAWPHGVASGDPTRDGVTLWTRPGAEEGRAVAIRWEVGELGATAAVRQGTVVADHDHDHCVHVRVDGLRPGTGYWYRFVGPDGARSPQGATRTLPAATESVRLGVACCADRTRGPWDAYDWLADQDPDVVVHLGDYIYEHGQDGPGGAHDPPRECTTLGDYRRRYAQYRANQALKRLHATAPWLASWDDHEVVDDASPAGPGGERCADDPAWIERRDSARRAYREWLPLDPAVPDLDRYRRFGDLLDLVMIDTRLGGREPQLASGRPVPAPDEGPDLLSSTQWDGLADAIAREAPESAWLLVVSQVQVSPLRLGYVPALGWPPWRPLVNPDQWDGYPGARERLLDLVESRAARLAISGDLHGTFLTRSGSGTRALPELTIPAVSSLPFADVVARRLPFVRPLLTPWLRLCNPHLRHVDIERNGAALLDVTSDCVEIAVWYADGSPLAARLPRGSEKLLLPGGMDPRPRG